MDRSLDEILAERGPRGSSRGGRGANRRRGGGHDYPRDGIRKPFRDDSPRNLDSEWVHDRFDDRGGPRAGIERRRRSPEQDSRGTRLRVDNIHYELTEEDLQGLFSKIGPIQKLQLLYDRAGRSEGQAFVTYGTYQDAQRAIREYDGANAAGQPIRLSIVPSAPAHRRNPFDTAVLPGRSLADRITVPAGRSRSFSPARAADDDDAGRRGGDKYRPGGNRTRSRSPLPPRRREAGRRPGARREGGAGGGTRGGGERGAKQSRDGRVRKTQEELDAEMADYFGGDGHGAASTATANGGTAAGQATEDADMIE